MSVLARLNDFADGDTIFAEPIDNEFNQLVELLNGTTTNKEVYVGGPTPSGSQTPKFFVKGSVMFELDSNGTVLSIWRTGESFARISFLNSGHIRTPASQHSTTSSVVGAVLVLMGTLYASSSNVGNVSTGEDDLMSFVVYGQTLYGVGNGKDYLKIRAAGNTAANGNNKQIKFYIGATQVLASGAVAFNNKPWFFEADVLADADSAANQVQVAARFICDTTEVRVNTTVSGYDLTADKTFKFTGEGTATDDIVQTSVIVEKGWSAN